MAASGGGLSSASGGGGGEGGGDSGPSASSAIDFLSVCQRLKSTKRAGWVLKGVEAPESVADHMHRMGLMALIAADIPGLDRDRCIKMAIVHDIAEAIVGDITPSDGVPKEEKTAVNNRPSITFANCLGWIKRWAQEIHGLWMEYEQSSSLEAKIVKDFDKVEMILQALEYETEQGKNLDDFFQSTAGARLLMSYGASSPGGKSSISVCSLFSADCRCLGFSEG
ncbi:hypothetical protein Syun_031537 [Stephania yunnanensis]|uniref:5'-deoxynucleotidase n=1 Tax=Stephania yunnanensis TaxID=152371 RepID=A0AAP0E0V3_9MAGN